MEAGEGGVLAGRNARVCPSLYTSAVSVMHVLESRSSMQGDHASLLYRVFVPVAGLVVVKRCFKVVLPFSQTGAVVGYTRFATTCSTRPSCKRAGRIHGAETYTGWLIVS